MPDSIAYPHGYELKPRSSPSASCFSAAQIEDAFRSFMHANGYPDLVMEGDSPMMKLTGGTCSQTWKMHTSEGPFVMSIAENPMQRMHPEDVNHFEKYLFKRHKELLPEPIGRLGWMPDDKSFFQVSRFVPATSFDDLPNRELNDAQLQNLGTVLAQVHLTGVQFHRDKTKVLRDPTLTEKLNFFLNNRAVDGTPGSHLLQSKVGTVGEALRKNAGRSLKVKASALFGRQRGLPKGIIHGDFNHTNVLFDGDKPIIIDWANANYDTLISEVAQALVEFVILPEAQKTGIAEPKAILEKSLSFLAAYNQTRQLTREEGNILPDMLGMEAVMVGIRPLIGQGDRYAKGALPQGTMLQDAVHDLCINPLFHRGVTEIRHQHPQEGGIFR